MTKTYLSKLHQNFAAGFIPDMDLKAQMKSSFGFIDANGFFGYFIFNYSR